MNYRADINGLRAIAVLAVIGNHIDAWAFQGGFLGVDVFFVISGFIITKLISSEIGGGRFAFASFYQRRFRRIAPALFATVSATFLLAYFYLLPTELTDFVKAAVAAIFGVSNFYFWRQAGYFDALASAKPLVHTWSLAVEEQFYLVFPAVLIVTARMSRALRNRVLIALFAVSLTAAIAGTFYWPEAAFYLAPMRAWEFLLGTLIALNVTPRLAGSAARNVAGAAGLALIAGSVTLASKELPLLGLATLPACIGAGLVISAGQSGPTLASRILSSRPLVLIGLMSYSLYLWHWPVIVFHRLGFLQVAGLSPKLDKALLVLVSLALAYLSWRFIEQPFRKRGISRGRLKSGVVVAAAVLASFSIVAVASNGMAFRLPDDVVRVSSYLDYDSRQVARIGTCYITTGYTFANFTPGTCTEPEQGKRNVLLMGDSFAAHFWFGLSEEYPELNVMQATASGCKPIIYQGPDGRSPNYRQAGEKWECDRLMSSIFTGYVAAHRPDAILLLARWSDHDLADLPATLAYARLHADSVILFGPMVQYDAPLPRLLARSFLVADPAYPFRHRTTGNAELDSQMAAVARTAGVEYVSFSHLLCAGAACITRSDPTGAPLLYDSSHLTADGAITVATRMRADHALTW